MLERIEAAEKTFYEKWEAGASEWEETFGLGAAFARRLLDCSGCEGLIEAVVVWLEESAALAPEDS